MLDTARTLTKGLEFKTHANLQRKDTTNISIWRIENSNIVNNNMYHSNNNKIRKDNRKKYSIIVSNYSVMGYSTEFYVNLSNSTPCFVNQFKSYINRYILHTSNGKSNGIKAPSNNCSTRNTKELRPKSSAAIRNPTVLMPPRDQYYEAYFAVLQVPKMYGRILMHYSRHKMSLHLQIFTIKMKMTQSLEAGVNMST